VLLAELKESGTAAERTTTAIVQRYGGESGDVQARLIKHWLATSGTALGCPMMTWLKSRVAPLGVTFSFVQSAGLPEMMALMDEVEGLPALQAQGIFEVARYLLLRLHCGTGSSSPGPSGLGLCMTLPGGAGFSSGSGPEAPWERIWSHRWYAAIDLLMEARRQLGLGGPFQRVERPLWDAAVAAASEMRASLYFSGPELAGKGARAGVADDMLTLAQFQSSSSASAGAYPCASNHTARHARTCARPSSPPPRPPPATANRPRPLARFASLRAAALSLTRRSLSLPSRRQGER
jgi:hypothetical protein